MIRLLIGVLVTANLLVLLYLVLDPSSPSIAARHFLRHRADMGTIRLISSRVGGETEWMTQGRAGTERKHPVTAIPPLHSPEPASVSVAQTVEGELNFVAGRKADIRWATDNPPGGRPRPSKTAVPKLELYCGEIGPFSNRGRAAQLESLLGVEQKTEIVQRDTPVVESYWVHLPPRRDRREAQRMMQVLRQAGFRDLWLVPDWAYRNAISLGLYSNRKSAVALAERLRQRGFEAILTPRARERARFWLTFVDLPDSLLREIAGELSGDAKVRKSLCGGASAKR